MQSFKSFLTERFVNAFDAKSKTPYVDAVWDILQKSYADQGGIKGNGFASKSDMIAHLPMWKMIVQDGKVIAAALYKDTSGRKRVAVGTDGSELAREKIRGVVKADLDRSYVEMSGRSFSSLLNAVGADFMMKYAKTPEEAGHLLGKPVDEPDKSDIMYHKAPTLQKYMYSRKIGPEHKTKIMLGTSGKKIIV